MAPRGRVKRVEQWGKRSLEAAAESEGGEIEECVSPGTDRKGGRWGSLAHAFNEREGAVDGGAVCVEYYLLQFIL